MLTLADQTGREVICPNAPQRIVSLVPSQTELLYDLGLRDEVIGITKFCVHPSVWFKNKTRIGGTKNLNLEKIVALNPDLILANKEENTREQIEWLMQRFPVWISDIHHLDDAYSMILSVGEMCQKDQLAKAMIQEIQEKMNALAPGHVRKSAYFIWQKPLISVGSDTFIHAMMQQCGFENAFGNFSRYPEISEQMLRDSGLEFIFLSSEPFPFQEKHKDYFQKIIPAAKIELVDGTYFSWYGSRLLKATDYFNHLLSSLTR